MYELFIKTVNKLIGVLLTMRFSVCILMMFVSLNYLLSQSLDDIKIAKDLQAQVKSGKISASEAITIARDMGATESQMEMAAKELKLEDPKSTPPIESSTVTSKVPKQKKSKPYIKPSSISNPIPKEKIEVYEVDKFKNEASLVAEGKLKKKTLSYFGYDFFKGAPTSFQPVQIGPVDDNYQIGPGDEIVVNIWGDTELRYVIEISREGLIYIDNVGQIGVNGLTLESLEKKLKSFLSKVYESISPISGEPTTFLDVTLGKLKPITVFFMGEMKKLGAYQVDSYSTAFTALYYVGGPSIKGSLREIQIIRDGKVISTFDLYDYLMTGKRIDDIRLQNEDHIFIPPRKSTIHLTGEILRPGIYELNEEETLDDLIKFAGDLLTNADLDRVQFERVIPFKDRTHEKNIRTVKDYTLTTKDRNGNIEINSIQIEDLDVITIFPVLDLQLDYVTISGAVHREGKYALKEGMTLADLIHVSQGFENYAYLEKADLTRTYQDETTEHFDIDLTSSDIHTFLLNDWDHLRIYSIWDLQKKEFATISGHVWNPGKYTLHDSMSVSDLLFKAGGLDDPYFWQDTYQKRADLIRYNEDQLTTRIIPIHLEELVKGNNQKDIQLHHRDNLKVYDIDVIFTPETVKISGEVNSPGEFNLNTNMGIHDLILRAGGFKKNAYVYEVVVFRIDPFNVSEKQLSTIHKVTMKPDLLLENFDLKNDFQLEDRDLVVVREHPEFEYQRNVTISGKVLFPGIYSLSHKHETIRDVISRAGGLKQEAFIDGIQFTRLGKNITGDFNKILYGASRYDIPLLDGDQLFIPEKPGVIVIEGLVNNPGLIKYQKGWSLADYIDSAGGYHTNADKSNIIVYYPGGEAKKDGWIFSPKISEGSRIVIGAKEKQEDIDWTEIIKETASIAASVVTIMYIISK